MGHTRLTLVRLLVSMGHGFQRLVVATSHYVTAASNEFAGFDATWIIQPFDPNQRSQCELDVH